MKIEVTAGFDGPLEIENDLKPAEVLAIVQRFVPVDTGRLRESLHVYRDPSNPDGYVVTSRGPAAVYARIQDEGGVIPAREAVNASVMRFEWKGQVWFRKAVGPSIIKGHHYTDRAFDIIADGYNKALRWARKYVRRGNG